MKASPNPTCDQLMCKKGVCCDAGSMSFMCLRSQDRDGGAYEVDIVEGVLIPLRPVSEWK